MTKEQKIQLVGLGVWSLASVAQMWGAQRLLQHVESLERDNAALRQAGLYLINVVERENVHLTEFDELALQILLSNREKSDKDDNDNDNDDKDKA